MPSSSRTTHYHRFIPSEEVQAVEAWVFQPVGEGAPEAPGPTEEAPTPASLPPEAVEDIRQQAYAEGFEQGRQAGAQEARDTLEKQFQRQSRELADRVAQVVNQAQQHFDQLEHELADQLLELACDIARQVVRRELTLSMDPLRAVVQEALSLAIDDGRPITLRLHPEDAALLHQADWEPGSTLRIQLQPDNHIARGGCVVEHAQGAVDARVEKRWARAVANLGLDAPWQPGEDADV